MLNLESWLKWLLQIFGGFCVLAIVPFVMPVRWMAAGHEWLGLGVMPEGAVVEYLARGMSAMCAFYGGLLIVLASNVRRFSVLIQFQAVTMIFLASCGAYLGMRAGMPAWWMLSDALSCWVCLGAMFYLSKRIDQHGAVGA